MTSSSADRRADMFPIATGIYLTDSSIMIKTDGFRNRDQTNSSVSSFDEREIFLVSVFCFSFSSHVSVPIP